MPRYERLTWDGIIHHEYRYDKGRLLQINLSLASHYQWLLEPIKYKWRVDKYAGGNMVLWELQYDYHFD